MSVDTWHSECIAIAKLITIMHCNWPQFNWVKEGNETAGSQSSFFSIVRFDISVILVQNLVKIPAPLPTQPICQSMPVSNFQTLLKSCSIEPEMIQVQFKDILFNRCLGGAGILRVGLVLWVQYPVEAIFFCWFWYPVMSILYKNDRNVRSDNWEKTRVKSDCLDEIVMLQNVTCIFVHTSFTCKNCWPF